MGSYDQTTGMSEHSRLPGFSQRAGDFQGLQRFSPLSHKGNFMPNTAAQRRVSRRWAAASLSSVQCAAAKSPSDSATLQAHFANPSTTFWQCCRLSCVSSGLTLNLHYYKTQLL